MIYAGVAGRWLRYTFWARSRQKIYVSIGVLHLNDYNIVGSGQLLHKFHDPDRLHSTAMHGAHEIELD